MRHLTKLLSVFSAGLFACSVMVGSASAQTLAKVLATTGNAELIIPGQPAKPLVAGMSVPVGATIKTGANGEVTLEAVPGAISNIRPGSELFIEALSITKDASGKVTEQVATVDLKNGNVVSTVNPSMKDVNKYGVRTPKGVAAARGTVYGVTVNPTGTRVSSLAGTVSINLGPGLPPLILPVGTTSANGSAAQAISAYIAANPGVTAESLKADIVDAVKMVANNITAKTSSVDTPNEAIATIAAVVKAAAQAVPESVTAITKIAIAAVVSNTSATGSTIGDRKNTTRETAVADGEFAAVRAVSEAAALAVPAQAVEIAKAASAQVVETNVAQAVTRAVSALGANPDPEAKAVAVQLAVDTAIRQSATTNKAAAQGVIEASRGNSSDFQKSTLINNAVEASTTASAKIAAVVAGQNNSVQVVPPTTVTVSNSSTDASIKSTTITINKSPEFDVGLKPVSPAGP